MTTPLLEINVNNLFEEHTVAEIHQIHKKLQSDVEAKKEELRTMVGERYRDLLKAADTIGEMKNASQSITDQIGKVMGTCRSLNDQQLLGFKSEPQQFRTLDRHTNDFYGIVVQIKLLTELPELIWTRIDAEDYFVATQLFVFSRHISTGLKMEVYRSIMDSFPVAKRLWSMLNPFFYTIKQECMATLERETLTSATAAKCLASLILLENCPIDKLFQTFTQLRSKAFKQALADNPEQNDRVKEKIVKSLVVLNGSIMQIFECFVDAGGNNGLLLEELHRAMSDDAPPTLSLIKEENSLLINTLPGVIKTFKPKFNVSPLESDKLKRLMEAWLQDVSTHTKNYLKPVFDVVATVKTIHNIKTEAFAMEKSPKWQTILVRLNLPSNLDLYNVYYQPLITERLKEIIAASWSKTIEETQQKVDVLIKSKSKDLQVKIWDDESTDIPLSLKQALSQDKKCHRLLLKSKGYTQRVITVCDTLDRNMKDLFDDLKVYLVEELDSRNTSSLTLEDRQRIAGFLNDASRDGVSRLITNIKSLNIPSTQATVISLAILLQAIAELCPNLKLCLTQRLTGSLDQLSLGTGQWDAISNLLQEESLRFWKTWIGLFVNEHLVGGLCFAGSTSYTELLNEFTAWETISIEEKDELDNPILSTIRVPSQVSLSLNSFLYKMCRSLNTSVPHTLSRAVTTLLTEEIVAKLVETYQKLSADDFVRSNQNMSLQCFFDVKFIGLVLVARENKLWNEKLQALCGLFKANIDPFDFELFHNYILTNVKRTAVRMQLKLGLILPNAEHITTLLGNEKPAATTDKDPNVLALSRNDYASGYFPLLPVTQTSNVKTLNPGKSSVEEEKESAT
ncbi:conserved oligomeric Golgi complex subunit 1 isoform X2 [Bradysia coprophila]|uniref:conserved oligomeric Golgi complex subunit 1 isoform X2 n=1 Tax=Bradysia coprophila TaxID=38358 RepID=UPI00187DDAA5|nr:conserved oligomeric Golgi complex subunit 1 isoform X2 [Bradysia coprophila]